LLYKYAYAKMGSTELMGAELIKPPTFRGKFIFLR